MQNTNSKLNTFLLIILVILACVIIWIQWHDRKAEEGKDAYQSSLPSGQTQATQNSGGSDYQPNSTHTLNSATYGYSINYSGIDKGVGDESGIFLAKDQSYVDQLQIVDATLFVKPQNWISKTVVVFGGNHYERFKDTVTSRHTYYFYSPLKNGKALLISVEGDSDLPNYLDLASLKILN
jgi:hypothetical protein